MRRPKPKIAVTFPSSYLGTTAQYRDEIKSAPWTLASYLAQYFDVEYVDFEAMTGRPNTPMRAKRFERKVREYFESNPCDIIAISCWTSLSYQTTCTVARIAREVSPKSIIVVGGYHPSGHPRDFFSPPGIFDYVIRGEGEIALQQIAENCSAGRPPQTTIIDSPALLASQLAPVDFSLIDPIVSLQPDQKLVMLTFFLSRGCPFSCSYCVESLKESVWRPFTPEAAIRQVQEAISRYNPDAVGFGDACFGVQASWRKRFLQLLADLKPSCWILFETRAEFLDDEDIALLATMKVEIQFGVEHASPTMLKIMNKTKQPEKFLTDFRRVSHRLSDHGIIHGANIIFNHPGETESTLRETFAFMDEELKRTNSSLLWACHGYMHFPGSAVDRDQQVYVDQYGASFDMGEWWKTDGDPYVASRRVTPSHDLSGERRLMYQKMLKDRDEAMRASLTPAAFKMAADYYYTSWQSDPRYDGNA